MGGRGRAPPLRIWGVCLREGGIGWNAEEKSAVGGVDADGFSGVLGPEDGVFGAGGAAVPDGDDKISSALGENICDKKY